MNDDLTKQKLPKDARLAAKCLADTGSFETGQTILVECADRIEELEDEVRRLRGLVDAIRFRMQELKKPAPESQRGGDV